LLHALDAEMNTQTVSFILMMGALGNILFAVSYYAVPISLGINLDLSLIAVFIAGYYGGPRVGATTGILAGLFAGVMFGPMGMGSWLGLIGLPVGKALTGLFAGFSSRIIVSRKKHVSILAVPLTLLSYVPEALFTYAYFAFLMPTLLGGGGASIFLLYVLPKAVGEVTMIGFLMATLVGNRGFSEFVNRFFPRPVVTASFGSKKPD